MANVRYYESTTADDFEEIREHLRETGLAEAAAIQTAVMLSLTLRLERLHDTIVDILDGEKPIPVDVRSN